MNFIEKVNKLIAEGKISSSDSLELKTHYNSLIQKEKDEFESKFLDNFMIENEHEIQIESHERQQSPLTKSKGFEVNISTADQLPKNNVKNLNQQIDKTTIDDNRNDASKLENDHSIINIALLKQLSSYDTTMSYKTLIKELLLRLIPISVLIVIFISLGNIPSDKIPKIITTFSSIAGATVFFYTVAAFYGFLKSIFKKAFGSENKDK
ncbi:MAG: hypothetical protein M0P71_16585 [Melioribacteraceae bacterium]|nr:hypothetical protein [Melioribacteraceae bacterium]